MPMTEQDALASIKAQFAREQAAQDARQASDGLWRSQMNLHKAIESGNPEEIARQQENVARFQAKYDASRSAVSDADKTTAAIESNNRVTNPPQTDAATAEKYADPSRTPDTSATPKTQEEMLREQEEGFNDKYGIDTESEQSKMLRAQEEGFDDGPRPLPAGAKGATAKPASAQWSGAKDLRVILRVPNSYLIGPAAGPSNTLKNYGGILFPYTPQISYENQATYSNANPTHSNYTQYFFKNSSVSPIQLTAKFTAQDQLDAGIWLSIVHLLRGLTKMRFGDDTFAGSPPPVCRLDGYGDYVLSNVPVVVGSFRIDLPDSVDYISVTTLDGGKYKNSLVPTMSTLTLSLFPMYSRREIRDFSVDKWLGGSLRSRGYL